jgi:gluconate kinase
MNKLPTNIQSIVHIINNWNFVYEDSKVKATLEVFVDIDELKTLRNEYNASISSGDHLSDEDKKSYVDAINDLNLTISELETN